MTAMINQVWYQQHPLRWLLWPLSLVYQSVVSVRKWAYQHQWLEQHQFKVPIIVIGNISVGGTGKTPVVIALARWLLANGYRPGVVSRGYKGKARSWPQFVNVQSDPFQVGDEPVLIATKTGVPVVVGPKRVAVVNALLEQYHCDVIISDDGLQHYAMAREFEVAVVDAKRGLGNELCLPAGPLREPKSRLREIDYMLVNGSPGVHGMQLVTGPIYNIQKPLDIFDHSCHQNQIVHAVAGIGNPDRFFSTLSNLGFQLIQHRFPDHAAFSPADLAFDDDYPIIMTEKDRVKCRDWCSERCYALPVEAKLPNQFYDKIRLLLAKFYG